jgi:hypothetical protein
MQELTDDQLDGLFRKSTEEFEPEFDAAAWQAMQQQLNDRDKTLFWGKLLRWGVPALVLLITGSSWYVYENRSPRPVATVNVKGGLPTNEIVLGTRNEKRSNHAAKLTHQQSLPDQSVSVQAQAKVSQAKVPAEPKPLIEEVSATESPKKPEPATIQRNGVAVVRSLDVARGIAASSPIPFTTPAARPTKVARSHRAKATSRQAASTAGFTQSRAIASAYQNPVTSRLDFGSTKPDQSLTESAFPVTLVGLDTLANKPAKWPVATALSQHEVTQPVVEASPITLPPVRQMSLSVRLLVSPDLSSVGLKDFQRPGTNFGALLEYQFANRWRVQAGVLRSVKVYESAAGRYEWGTNSWPVQPESVYGRCNMLDIPLNLRYDFALRPRPDGRQNRWFVSGGVTTYIMLREDYSYNYANPDDPRINDRAREWTTSTGSYGFSHLNVSAGYERAFGKRLSWQVEPFVKVPLKGVGYYKLNLISTGAFFSLRYKLR